MSDRSEQNNDWDVRIEIFERSYDEVLKALKHQDDKLNRTLTATAFLTAAGVALYTSVGQRVEAMFEGSGLSVTPTFFIVFLVTVVLTLGITLAAIGPSTWLSSETKVGERPTSLLFYALISKDKNWHSYLSIDLSQLKEKLARNLHHESQIIAKRVDYKVARAREAGAFLFCILVALCLLGIFSVEALNFATRWQIAASFLAFLLLLPFWDLVQMARFGYETGTPSKTGYGLLAISTLLSVILLMMAEAWSAHWMALWSAIGLILLARLSLIHRSFAKVLLPIGACASLVLLLVGRFS